MLRRHFRSRASGRKPPSRTKGAPANRYIGLQKKSKKQKHFLRLFIQPETAVDGWGQSIQDPSWILSGFSEVWPAGSLQDSLGFSESILEWLWPAAAIPSLGFVLLSHRSRIFYDPAGSSGMACRSLQDSLSFSESVLNACALLQPFPVWVSCCFHIVEGSSAILQDPLGFFGFSRILLGTVGYNERKIDTM